MYQIGNFYFENVAQLINEINRLKNINRYRLEPRLGDTDLMNCNCREGMKRG